ncbi:hypothetical protein QR680_010140 [Steinernema hermaphroditum]|uniref:Uncharacterized protein n=1 Tax=Steinernema hermaphroditum TaxID=289476 RepID=A0AA39MA50_9BILA|nr:hypothetical protein QR680_010140 [Steinernema hermaphroditum]
METTLSVVYGRTLDIAALGSFTIKPFAIFIIAFYTPKYLRSTSYFILNEMLWNLAGNLLFVLGRPFPMLPTQCIRLDGLIGPYLENEWMRHAFFLLIVASSVNCNIGLLTMFRFRYMVIANKEFISRTRPLWGYAICIMLHIAGTAIFVALNVNAATTIEEYSNTESIPSAANLFCFKRSGWQKNLLLWSFFASMIGFKVLLVAYTLLCFYELRKQKSSLEKFTVSCLLPAIDCRLIHLIQ